MAEDEGIPYFRALFHEMQEYEGTRLVDDVLEPWLLPAERAVSDLVRFKDITAAQNLGEDDLEDEWQWYALSRVNNLFILDMEASRAQTDWREREPIDPLSEVSDLVAYTQRWIDASFHIGVEEYLSFFEDIGFQRFEAPSFNPLYHEIVQVEQAGSDAAPTVQEVFWPGLMFGDMVFSRAGVRVSAGESAIKKRVAENSVLHFTYSRLARPTDDLSHGWGSNSQWRTSFRFDYRTEQGFHHNVNQYPHRTKAKYEKYENGLAEDGTAYRLHVDTEPGELIHVDERLELLTNRCYVRTEHPKTEEPWPYDDTCFVPG